LKPACLEQVTFQCEFRAANQRIVAAMKPFSSTWNAGLWRTPAAAAFLALSFFAVHAEQLQEQKYATERELSEIRDEIRLSATERARLTEEIASLEKDRATINRNLIDASARQRTIEERIDRATGRLQSLRSEQEAARESLRGRKALLGEVLAALQRMSHNPPPAILVRPEDALSAVRSAILLGAVIPEIRAETQVLVAELAELVRIDNEISAQRNVLTADLTALAQEEQRLNLLLSEKREITNGARQELAGQSAHAAELAAKATNLGKLIETLEVEITAVREAAEEAKRAEQARIAKEAGAKESPAAGSSREFSDMMRIAPAVEFSKAAGLLPMPANGVVVRQFGAAGGLGERSEGISIATRTNATVISPTDGWVVYSGPFRSYGQLLILNAGSGYHVILAGMDSINVQLGQFVLVGEPIARMGAQRIASMDAVGLESTRPVLYVEFRKDDQSIDPTPWWADPMLKRVADDS
jgi:murein hydrolase activator